MHFRPAVKVIVVFVFVLIIATSVFAANSGKIMFWKTTQVSGQQLPAGEYKLTWTGTGDNVDVKLVNGDKVVTVKAKLVETPQKNRNFAQVVDQNGNLTRIDIRGQKQALSF